MHAPPWQLTVDRLEGSTTIRLSGELDFSTDPDVRETIIRELQRPGLARLLIDMQAVVFIDSTVTATLVYTYDAAHTAACQLTVVPSDGVRRIVELTGLSYLLDPPDR